MSINPLCAPQAASNSGNGTQGTQGSPSDFDSFMKILACELQNQDPTEPVKNTEYVAQLAQVESLSQLQYMNGMLTLSSAYALIGKSVTYRTTDDSGNPTTATGTVQAVVEKNNGIYFLVNGGLVPVSDVYMVAPVPDKGDSGDKGGK